MLELLVTFALVNAVSAACGDCADLHTLTCTSNMDALTCAPGYVLNNQQTGGRKCIACTANTLTCNAGAAGSDLSSHTISTKCSPGFFLDTADPVGCSACGSGNIKYFCDPMMSTCPTVDPTSSLTCCDGGITNTTNTVGSVLNNAAGDRECIACSAGTATCTAGAQGADFTADTISTKCSPGFFLDTADPVGCSSVCGSDNIKVNCDISMSACHAVHPTSSLTCCDGGITNTANTVGSVLNNATGGRECIACSAGTATCTAGAQGADFTAGTISTSCLAGYYLTDYQGTQPPMKCVACENVNTLTCVEGPQGASSAETCAAGHTLADQRSCNANCGLESWLPPCTNWCGGKMCVMSPTPFTCEDPNTLECDEYQSSRKCSPGYFLQRVGNDFNGWRTTCMACGSGNKSLTCSATCTLKPAWPADQVTSWSCTTIDLTCVSGTHLADGGITNTVGNVLNNATGGRQCIACSAGTVVCTAGAQGADMTIDTISTSCFVGYYLKDHKCVPCDATSCTICHVDAATCSSSGEVVMCANNFLKQEKVCGTSKFAPSVEKYECIPTRSVRDEIVCLFIRGGSILLDLIRLMHHSSMIHYSPIHSFSIQLI